ncbi:MAG: ribosomal protein S18-alanine N-acetyltransferase [Chthonomonadales bacterium]
MAILVDPVVIEPMRRTDVREVAAIEKRCYPSPWHENAYYAELSNRCARYLVARLDGRIVGYGGMWVVMDEAHITTLAVDPEFRRRKIAQRLLIALLEEAVILGAARATLEVRESNLPAQTLYRKFGFHVTGVRRAYYTDNGENALVMWAEGIGAHDYVKRLEALRKALYSTYDADLRHRDELR